MALRIVAASSPSARPAPATAPKAPQTVVRRNPGCVFSKPGPKVTGNAYEQFGYGKIPAERKEREVSLVDLNDEGRYETLEILDDNLHLQPVRLAARLLDPDAFVICSAILKTHNTVVATLSLKNMALGAPLHSPRKESRRWNDKRIYHGGVRQTHVDIALTAQRLHPCWGLAVVDGWEGMEGNGPGSGTPVPSRVAIASTDYVAADRVGVELGFAHPDRPVVARAGNCQSHLAGLAAGCVAFPVGLCALFHLDRPADAYSGGRWHPRADE